MKKAKQEYILVLYKDLGSIVFDSEIELQGFEIAATESAEKAIQNSEELQALINTGDPAFIEVRKGIVIDSYILAIANKLKLNVVKP